MSRGWNFKELLWNKLSFTWGRADPPLQLQLADLRTKSHRLQIFFWDKIQPLPCFPALVRRGGKWALFKYVNIGIFACRLHLSLPNVALLVQKWSDWRGRICRYFLSFILTLATFGFQSATSSCFVELREVVTPSRIFHKLHFFADFTGRNREAPMRFAGVGAQRPVLNVKWAEKEGCARARSTAKIY